MAFGAGKSNQDQNQNQSGQYSGGTMDQSAGIQQSAQSGVTSGQTQGQTTGQTAGHVTVDPTAQWLSGNTALQGLLGSSGLTPQQRSAMGMFSPDQSAAYYNPQNSMNALDYAGTVMSRYVDNNHPAYSINGPGTVQSPTASSFLGNYAAPTQQVVDATTNQLTGDLNQKLNGLQAQFGGQYGNNGAGVAMGQAVGDYGRNIAPAIAGLNLSGYQTGLGAAQADAERQFGANTANAGNTMQQQMFNTQQKNLNDQQSLQTIRDWVGDQSTKQSMMNTYGNNMQTAAGQQFGMGQSGVGNLASYLGLQTPAFGQSSTGTTAGTTAASSLDTSNVLNSILNLGLSAGDAAGNSSGTSTGHSSGKNGGLSIG